MTNLRRGVWFGRELMQPSFSVLVWAFPVVVMAIVHIMVLVGVSFSMLIYYNEHNEAQGLLEIKSSTTLGLVCSNQFLFFSLQLPPET